MSAGNGSCRDWLDVGASRPVINVPLTILPAGKNMSGIPLFPDDDFTFTYSAILPPVFLFPALLLTPFLLSPPDPVTTLILGPVSAEPV